VGELGHRLRSFSGQLDGSSAELRRMRSWHLDSFSRRLCLLRVGVRQTGGSSFPIDHAIPASHIVAFQNYGDAGPVDLELHAEFSKSCAGLVGSDQFIDLSRQQPPVDLLDGSSFGLLMLLRDHFEQLVDPCALVSEV